jgi:hypothetical protein
VIIRVFFSKLTNFDAFRHKAIRYIKIAIRHMWRVANGLDNAGLNDNFFDTEEAD